MGAGCMTKAISEVSLCPHSGGIRLVQIITAVMDTLVGTRVSPYMLDRHFQLCNFALWKTLNKMSR